MTAALVSRLVARSRALRLARWAIIVLVVLLFLLAVRRAGERAGRLAERLEQLERNDAGRKQMLEMSGPSLPERRRREIVTGLPPRRPSQAGFSQAKLAIERAVPNDDTKESCLSWSTNQPRRFPAPEFPAISGLWISFCSPRSSRRCLS
ncbi:MAG: hypothetical protein ACQEUZ_00990 [Pseudomonadota bacterium]